MRRALLLGFLILLLLGGAVVALQLRGRALTWRGTLYEPPLPAPPFSLQKADGSWFRLEEQRGKIVLLFFGYTFCPDVCPTTLAELSQALARLDVDQQAQVQVVFISVDPERDTPERVQAFVRHFAPGFLGLSGSEAQLQSIWQAYGVYREIQQSSSAAGYLVNHSARVYLIDQEGNLRLTYAFGTPPEDLTHDLRLLLSGR